MAPISLLAYALTCGEENATPTYFFLPKFSFFVTKGK